MIDQRGGAQIDENNIGKLSMTAARKITHPGGTHATSQRKEAQALGITVTNIIDCRCILKTAHATVIEAVESGQLKISTARLFAQYVTRDEQPVRLAEIIRQAKGHNRFSMRDALRLRAERRQSKKSLSVKIANILQTIVIGAEAAVQVSCDPNLMQEAKIEDWVKSLRSVRTNLTRAIILSEGRMNPSTNHTTQEE